MGRVALLGLVNLIACLACSAAAEFWVAAQGGDDAGPGTREKPLATPAMAVRRARELRRADAAKAEGGITVYLGEGNYRLSETLVLRPADAGNATAPLILSSVEGQGAPVLSGGKVLGLWKRLEPGAGARIRPELRPAVWVAECRDANGEPLSPRQLWINGHKAVRARTPNAPDMARLTAWDRATRTAGMSADVLPPLADLRGVEMFVMQQWETAVLRLAELRREGASATLRFRSPEDRIEFEHPWPQPIMPPQGAGAFMLVGAPEFIDRPGEWAWDPADSRLYYLPLPGENMALAEAVVPVLERLVELRGAVDSPVTGVLLRGLSFAHAAWDRPSRAGHVPLQAGMYLEDGYSIEPKGTVHSPSLDNQGWIGRPGAAVALRGVASIRLEGCAFAHHAMGGLDIAGGAEGVRVEGCTFDDIGGNAIQAGSFQEGEGVETHVPYNPSDERELVRGLVVRNNVVRDAANEDWGCVGILAGYVRDTEIAHNEISDVSYTAISLGWGWTEKANCMRNNLVRANLIQRIATRMCDTAGVYTLSAQPGTVVERNVVRDIRMSPWVDRPDHWFYLYTDEGSSLITVRDNWTDAEKFLQNANGPGNVWQNNGPTVSPAIRDEAGLEPAWRRLR